MIINKVKKIIFHPVFLLMLLNLIFLSKPIFSGQYFAPTDWLQRFPAFSENFHVVENSFLADVVTQFQPWYEFNKNTLQQGIFPLWNDLNAGGVPHFANGQSSVLFPLNIFFLILPMRWALISFYFSKMFLIGFFTYLFLRQINIGKYESFVGAIGFNFALFNITWLLWPHTNVVLCLPIQLLIIERYMQGKDLKYRFISFLGISFALSVFGGHIQTTFHVTLISGLYFLFRLNMENNKSEKLKSFALSAILGIVLSSVQLIPFIEYLANSYVLIERGGRVAGELIPLPSIIYSIFPNISGNPATDFYRPLFEHTSYNQGTGAYLGTIILLLSTFWLIFLKKRNKKILFFFLISLFVAPFVFDIPVINIVGQVANIYASNTRLLFVIAFAQSVIAAYALNQINKNNFPNKVHKFLLFLIPILTVTVLIGINFVIPVYFDEIRSSKLEGFMNYLSANVIFFAVTTFLGLIVLYKMSKHNKREFYLVLTSLLVFLQTGVLNIKYNPSTAEEYFYPSTKEIQLLSNSQSGNFFQLGGNYIIHPDVNTYYGIKMVGNYDAVDIKEYKKLYKSIFDKKEHWNGLIVDTEQKYLDLFGVRYVGSYTDIANTISVEQGSVTHYLDGLKEFGSVTTSFLASEDGLYAIRLLPANYNRVNRCRYRVDVRNDVSFAYSQEYECKDLFDKIYEHYEFPVRSDSKDKVYDITVKFLSGKDDISFWVNADDKLVLQSLYQKNSKPDLEMVHDGRFKIYENKNYKGDFYFVNNARYLKENNIIDHIKSSNFDPYQEVVLEGESWNTDQLQNNEGTAEIRMYESSPTDHKLRILAETDGYIVTSLSYYPSWKATIDTRPAQVLRGNYAFAVIPINKGEHNVRFYYDPISYKIGLISSALGLSILLLIFFKYRRSTSIAKK